MGKIFEHFGNVHAGAQVIEYVCGDDAGDAR